MSEWTYKTVRELCSHVIDCRNKTAPVVDYPTPYKMLRTSNIRDGFVDTASVRYVLKATYDIWTSRGELEDGDVIFTREAPLGEVGILKKADGYFLGQRLVLFRANPQKCYNWFLNYALLCSWIKHKICGSGGGSIVTHLRVPDCEEIQIRIPADLSEQKRIADTLRVIDEKIELNRRLNDNLEAMAQALYDYWFVQFDFPDENGKPYKSSGGKMVWNEVLKREIPEGWMSVTLGEVCKMYQPHTLSLSEIDDSSDYFVYGANGIIGKYCEYNHEESEVAIACRGNSCGTVNRTLPKSWITGNAMVIKMLDSGVHNEYILRTIPHIGIHRAISGSGQPQITRENIQKLKLTYPDNNKTLKRYSEIAQNIVTKLLNLSIENFYLSSQRDFLLPLLMNGQVQVKPQGELNYHFC